MIFRSLHYLYFHSVPPLSIQSILPQRFSWGGSLGVKTEIWFTRLDFNKKLRVTLYSRLKLMLKFLSWFFNHVFINCKTKFTRATGSRGPIEDARKQTNLVPFKTQNMPTLFMRLTVRKNPGWVTIQVVLDNVRVVHLINVRAVRLIKIKVVFLLQEREWIVGRVLDVVILKTYVKSEFHVKIRREIRKICIRTNVRRKLRRRQNVLGGWGNFRYRLCFQLHNRRSG